MRWSGGRMLDSRGDYSRESGVFCPDLSRKCLNFDALGTADGGLGRRDDEGVRDMQSTGTGKLGLQDCNPKPDKDQDWGRSESLGLGTGAGAADGRGKRQRWARRERIKIWSIPRPQDTRKMTERSEPKRQETRENRLDKTGHNDVDPPW